LTDTKIGRGVNSIAKDGIFKAESINKEAFELVGIWKNLVKSNKQPREERDKNN
jgi:hypothetical protein